MSQDIQSNTILFSCMVLVAIALPISANVNEVKASSHFMRWQHLGNAYAVIHSPVIIYLRHTAHKCFRKLKVNADMFYPTGITTVITV